MNRASLAAIVVLGLGLGVAHAQPAQPAQPAAPNPAADAALSEGRRLYDLQEWDKAIEKFKEAYMRRDDAAALFNIAQSYRLKGDCASAASFYKTFKRKFPAEKVIDKVDKFIVEMDDCAKTQPTVPVALEPEPVDKPVDKPVAVMPEPPIVTDPVLPQPVQHSGGKRVRAYVSFGVGAVGLIVGGIGLNGARSAQNEAETLGANGGTWEPSIQRKGDRFTWYARGGFVVGGAGIIGGVVLLVLAGKDTETAPVALVPDENGAALVWSGRF